MRIPWQDTHPFHKEAQGIMQAHYEAPELIELGTVQDLTQNLDKIGSTADFLTLLIQQLDGSIVSDR